MKGDKLVVRCWSGCPQAELFAAVRALLPARKVIAPFDDSTRLAAAEPTPGESSPRVGSGGRKPEIEAVYPYTNEQGELLYQVVRRPGKNFSQRRPDGNGGFVDNLNGTRKVLYRLDELAAADSGRWVFIPEGEKHVDELIRRGLIATTNSGGADSWKSEYATSLTGRRVALLPDNDAPGRKRVKVAAASLAGVAAEVVVVELPGLPTKGDILDFFQAGHTVDELKALVKAAAPPLSAPIPATNGVGHKPDLGVWLKDVVAEPIDWLWPGYIALGMLTVIDGDPGLGKSTMALDLAARVSTRRAMPDGSPGVQGGVVILSGEDHLAKVIRPRLDAIDADLTRILSLEVVPANDGDGERDVEIPADLEYIEQAIVKAGAVLVIVDPLVAFLGADVNSHRDQDIRRVLRRLKALAERLGVAIVVIRHLNKAGGGNPLYRGGGSIGIIGAARGGLLVAPDPDVEGRVVMACSKSNLGQMPGSLAFYIEGAPNGAGMVRWDGASTHTSATLLAATQDGGSQGSVRQDGEEFLRATLAGGPRPTGQVEDDAADLGISARTLRRARVELGVVSYRESVQGEKRGAGQWLLRLPGSTPQTFKAANSSSKENLAALNVSEYESPKTVPEVGRLERAEGDMANQGELMVVDL